ncbi:MAG: phytanoyl-CoA dioxygenase family protein [Fimbriimonadaceae bacterium]|nr:phytanoyl-CoA dioxygenase family protein [Fimbriimonadaceae bacterium]
MARLTEEQVLSFHLRGFLSVPTPVADDAELARMREAYDRMFAQRAGRDSGDQFDLAGSDEDPESASLPQILNPAKYAPELNEGRYLQVLTEICQQLFGPEAQVCVAHAIFKPAGHGAATPWHQDEAYWDPNWQYQNASIWMPLQEATLENGCLWFVPGSHEWEVTEHQPIGGDVRVHGLEMTNLDLVKDAVACPLPAGGVTIHRNRTAHYAGPNTSETPRRALILGTGLGNRPYPGVRRFPWNEVKQTARDERAKASAA